MRALLHEKCFDALDRLRKEQRDDQDPGTSYAYDCNGNLTSITDPLGRITAQGFDVRSRRNTDAAGAYAVSATRTLTG